ncbi:hypothetical protein H671_7g17858 [Cricetulus griseus]|nr:hypothetical protein H671_7g17858 [Cricetulus griseus]
MVFYPHNMTNITQLWKVCINSKLHWRICEALGEWFLSESVEKQRSRLYGPVAILLVENEKETAVLRMAWSHLEYSPVLWFDVCKMFVYMVDYVDGFSYVEPSLHPWDEAYLIMLDDFSDMCLDSVHQYFIEYFSIDVHEGYRTV